MKNLPNYIGIIINHDEGSLLTKVDVVIPGGLVSRETLQVPPGGQDPNNFTFEAIG